MANLGIVVNADEIPERNDFTPVPPGTYTAIITESEMKATSSGGEMLVLSVELPDQNNRKIFERLNLKNDNETAVKIAFQTLGEIIRAVGKNTIKDSEELHNKRMTIDVVVEPAKPYMKDGVQQPGSPQNRIKKYSVFGSVSNVTQMPNQAQQTQSATAQPTAATAASSDALPPWKRK